jgi:hypothetical protein
MTLCKQAPNNDFDTFHRNMLMSVSRLQLALDNGVTIAQLAIDGWELADAIVNKSVEPIAVLTLARVYGLQWDEWLTKLAVASEKYELLKWLLKCGCPCDLDAILVNIDFDHFKRVRAAICRWPVDKLTELMDRAALYNDLDIAKWCREQGAEWPRDFFHMQGTLRVWPLRFVQWAIANGSTWLE